jgi:MFS family permease
VIGLVAASVPLGIGWVKAEERAAVPPLSRRWQAKWLVVLGCLIAGRGMLLFGYLNDAKWMLYLASGVQGAGNGIAYASLSTLIVAAVPLGQTGVASGMNANIRTIGGALGTAVAGSLVTAICRLGDCRVSSGTR